MGVAGAGHRLFDIGNWSIGRSVVLVRKRGLAGCCGRVLNLRWICFILATHDRRYQLSAGTVIRRQSLPVFEAGEDGDSAKSNFDHRTEQACGEFTFAYDRHCAQSLQGRRKRSYCKKWLSTTNFTQTSGAICAGRD